MRSLLTPVLKNQEKCVKIGPVWGWGRKTTTIKLAVCTLAGVAQWFEHQPANQRVTSLIPSQGTGLGCGPGPQQGTHERQLHIEVSLLLFLPPSPFL